MDKGKENQIFSDTVKEECVDQKINRDISDDILSSKVFIRLSAKGRKFKNIDFKYNIFDNCYLRNCVFESCDFTGNKFKDTNFYGATFDGCKFDYSTFERTLISKDILRVCCPGWENVKMKFARSLRVNFQEIGDAVATNEAIKVELSAEGEYLLKSWKSNETYYRSRFKGFKRVQQFMKWLGFKALDLIWGNGESVFKLIRSIIILFLIITLYDVLKFRDIMNISCYGPAFLKAFHVFFNVYSPMEYGKSMLALIAFLRLVMMGFFLSIIIKYFDRR
jgi:hypothetical protein